jgi:hypothetical protein
VASGQSPVVEQDNIVVVLDASGSMRAQMKNSRDNRMEAAKQALLTVVKDLPPNTNIGLLVFSSTNLRNDWAYPLGQVDKQKLAQAINRPQPGGGTPLGAYLKKGADALLKQRKLQHGFGTYRLLVVTDGQANDEALVQQYLPDVLGRGITVDVIGVDMNTDLPLATKVHSYRRADNPEMLVEAVKNVFAEVGSGGQDAAQSHEDFALLAAIPDEMAAAMLQALTTTLDHPIGEAPPPPPTTPGEPTAAAPTYDPFAHGPPPQVAKPTWFGVVSTILGGVCSFGFIAIVIVILIVRNIMRSNRGGSRP